MSGEQASFSNFLLWNVASIIGEKGGVFSTITGQQTAQSLIVHRMPSAYDMKYKNQLQGDIASTMIWCFHQQILAGQAANHARIHIKNRLRSTHGRCKHNIGSG